TILSGQPPHYESDSVRSPTAEEIDQQAGKQRTDGTPPPTRQKSYRSDTAITEWMALSVTVLSTGGTIASTSSQQGATPTKTGDELVSAVPEIESVAAIELEEITRTPSFDMDIQTLATVAESVRTADTRGTDGIVITHGTDTMAESAYYLDLVLDLATPVVLTGAQRRPDEISPDGPSNLLAAVRVASHDRFRDVGGVYIAFDEEIHAARDVVKHHTSRLSAFASPDTGPVARSIPADIRVYREPGSRSASLAVTEATGDIPMVKSGVGVGARQIRDALDAGVDGIVVEGTGLGNVTSALGDAIGAALDTVPVVVTSRCRGGTVAPVYGTAGGGETLHSHGVIDGRDRPARHARETI